MPESIFRAYDVRGTYPDRINELTAERIAFAVAKFLKAKKLVVGRDARVSSPAISEAVIQGLTAAGVNVIDIGQATTPLFYFSVRKAKTDGGIMVTASHNPAHYIGLKIVDPKAFPVGRDSGLAEIEKLAEQGIIPADKTGKIKNINLVNDYVNFIIKSSHINPKKTEKLRIVIDAGNGVTPLVLESLLRKVQLIHSRLFFEINGNFPNHSPDISRDENLRTLINGVILKKADLGFAFDGDGDRIAVFDSSGKRIRADVLLGLLSQPRRSLFGKKNPKVVFDLRTTRSVREFIGEGGIISKVGYTNIKAQAFKNKADIGGELSGHIIFKETQYSESSILAMLKILKIVSESGKRIEELVAPFEKYANSGEINLELRSMNYEVWEKTRSLLKERYKEGKISELDGLTVEFWDNKESSPEEAGKVWSGGRWWFNVRPSNTEPILRLVVEAETKELMEEKVREIQNLITSSH